ncbi:hypothetical protein QQ008_14160 [Fulvivirgaceae bacterium BMA10]|uniref:Uncharacterized protein n=1 Tax=Splendidivirga corallicola TaxID=3051826 RepID=A0ABT8KP44_9BACT|nr:hypothetical protein [Fulvivirgaceae bacterium BMA10]
MKNTTEKITIMMILFFVICSFQTNAQENKIDAFKNLIGGQWVLEGKQAAGLQGKSMYEFAWGINGKIVKVKYYNTDPKTLKFSLRNEGIRAFNAAAKRMEFYEFDKYGGVTIGTVVIEDKNIHADYEYHGLTLRDTWRYIDDNQYELITGEWKDGQWGRIYHKEICTRAKD